MDLKKYHDISFSTIQLQLLQLDVNDDDLVIQVHEVVQST